MLRDQIRDQGADPQMSVSSPKAHMVVTEKFSIGHESVISMATTSFHPASCAAWRADPGEHVLCHG